MNSTIVSALGLQDLTWYYGTNAVPAAKVSTVSVVGVGFVSTLTINGVGLTNAGSYTVHAKNSSGSVTSAPAIVLVASVANTVVTTVTNTLNFVAGATGMTSTGFKLQLTAPTGSNVVVQASTDLVHWTSITTNTVVAGVLTFTDTAALNIPGRYYRTYLK